MNKYLIDKGIGVSCKNKLQKEIEVIAESYHRVVINYLELDSTYQIICKQVDFLNSKNPRCKSEKVNTHLDNRSGDIILTIGGENSFVRLRFLKYEEI